MARNDLNDFAKRMDKRADDIESAAIKVVREVVKNMGPALGYSTPVDTSRARANWQAAINTMPTNVLYQEPDKPPTPETGAQLAIRSLDAAAALYKTGQTVYIVNNVRYINRLNAGHSAQAPAGFVQIAVHVAIRTIKNVRWVK